MKRNWRWMLTFVKIRVIGLSTLSGVTGFILMSQAFSYRTVIFGTALFVLASGSASLNQCQEYRTDAHMERTRNRPIPAGILTPRQGLTLALGLIAAGLAAIITCFGPVPAGLGLMTVLLYNGGYTRLKRVTPFAAIPGALIGALPPAIGATAAGGPLSASLITGLTGIFYLWQVPHFWLLAAMHANDYARSGLPLVTDTFTLSQLGRIIFTWISATGCAGMMLPLFQPVHHPVSLVLLTACGLWLLGHALPLLKRNIVNITNITGDSQRFKDAFIAINRFIPSIMVILVMDHCVLR
ncbi:MAG: protoheme IX farnesyltransferase [Candidatus Omnitrophota bacterium]